MRLLTLLRSVSFSLLLCLVGGGLLVLRAQNDGSNGPPKVLVIDREFTKPGKSGVLHEKAEAAFIHALSAANSQQHYFALASLSGQPRALFFFGYPSFAAWEEANKAVERNATLSAALDRAFVADGDLLSETGTTVWARRDDLSLNTGNLIGARYMEIRQFVVRPGHAQAWEELVKLVMAGYKKGVPEANWATFEEQYGPGGHGFLVITRLKSLADADQMLGSDEGFVKAMGEDGMKRLAELEASCIESRQTNLFQINPKMSYPPEAWVKAEPDFWKPKAAVVATKSPAAP
jgi:hypothetical protein